MTFSELLGERVYLSQYSISDVGLQVYKNGVAADADGNDVQVTLTSLDDETVIFPNRLADRNAVGDYSTTLSSVETQTPGIWKLTYTYELDGAPQTFVGLIEIGVASAAYDVLEDGMKGIIESAWIRFADLFDSPNGGPHLQVYFQSRFNRGRMAQLLAIALQKLNTMAQPHTTYTLNGIGGSKFPYAQWGGFLDQALYIEALKHLRRSYVEQPLVQNVAVARLDRRDYMDRWGEILNDELKGYESSAEVFKIAHMGLGRPRVLVSGGVFGTYGPTRLPGSAAARPRYWTRFY